jgi:hypothetical protein
MALATACSDPIDAAEFAVAADARQPPPERMACRSRSPER